MTRTILKLKLAGFPDLKVQFFPNDVINVVCPTPLSEEELQCIVRYLHFEGFCDASQTN